jgi:hypothetical protein
MLIIGISGACRREELTFLDVKNITDKGSYIIIQIPDTKTNVRREFTISPGNFEGLDLLGVFRTYFSLRPSPIEITRFFLGFRNGKCTRQAVGINAIGGVPKKIADFLNLPNSSNYTGHCFRRTSATLLADAGADITVLKRHGGWRSNTVAEGYIEDSVQNKLEVSSKILGKEQIINITQSDNVAPKCLLKNYFLNRARDNTCFNALVSADKGYTPLNLSDNIISDIVKPNIPDTIANIKQKSLHGRYFKELEQPEVNIQASHAWLKKSNIHPETEGFIFAIQDRVINTRNYKKHICGLQSIIDKCRICGTEGETIEHIISSCTVLAQSEYKKRHDIFAKIIHMNLAVKFNLLKNTQPHYSYTPESCLENDSYKLYFDRTILTDIHIKHNRPDIIILNKQQKQAYLLDIAVPNSHNITQTYNTKINKYLELSVAMRNLWCLEKISILPLVISATGIVPQSLFKNLKILDLDNTLVVEIQKGILLYSCHIVRKFLNIDTEHNTQQSQNAEARRR